jgi:hypothetical protein
MHPQQLFRTFSEGFSEGFLQDEYRKNRNQSYYRKSNNRHSAK